MVIGSGVRFVGNVFRVLPVLSLQHYAMLS